MKKNNATASVDAGKFVEEAIVGFVRIAKHITDCRTILELGKVANPSLILERPRLNVAGLTRVLNNYGVSLAIKQHGNAAEKSRRGRITVTLQNF